MDANQTRFHLLLGRADWARCRVSLRDTASAGDPTLRDCWDASPPGDTRCGLHWLDDRGELTLRPRPFHFTASAGDHAPKIGQANDAASSERRGAARDRFGNMYFISPDRREILVWSAGCRHTASFWACDGRPTIEPATHGMFRSLEATPGVPPTELVGLAITADHYLVVGTLPETDPAGTVPGGLLVFDLHAGGPPRVWCWPREVPFVPFDLAPRPGGGVWILDRKHRRFWALDRHLRVSVAAAVTSPLGAGEPDVFQSTDGTGTRLAPAQILPAATEFGAEVSDPVSIEALPDGTVLILDAGLAGRPSVIRRYRHAERQEEFVLNEPLTAPFEERTPQYFRPAYDFAFLPVSQSTAVTRKGCGGGAPLVPVDPADPERWGDLFVTTSQGNQTVRFALRGKEGRIRLEGKLDFFPMRLFGGRGLVTGGGQVYYDSNGRWVPLIRQDRPLFVERAVMVSREFDGRDPGCVWHRLLLDACLPPETAVEIFSRTADEKLDLALAPWMAEPALHRRRHGSELPFLSEPSSADAGTFELLFQKAQGRHLQLKLVLIGNGRSTPRLRALRIYYPRFSYLENYLPAVYREDRESASFLDRFLANIEGTNTAIEDRIAAAQMLFDWRSAPAETLAWLAQWFGVALDPAWDEPRQRLLIRHAMEFFRWRGTIHGLRMALHLAFDESVCDALFESPDRSCRRGGSVSAPPVPRKCRGRTDRFRVVEKFLLRRAPAVAFGQPEESGGPQRFTPSGPWTPQKGVGDLLRRFDEWRQGKDWQPFALGAGRSPEETADRTAFAQRELGFVPSDLAEDQTGWRNFLRGRYPTIGDLQVAHGGAWTDFDHVELPFDQPATGPALDDWRDYLSGDEPMPYETKRRLWQDFLARRYSGVGVLNEKYGTKWQRFDLISYPGALPTNPWVLHDWYHFESLVLPTLEAAHRFTVLLPFTGQSLPAIAERRQHLEVARRLVDMEKPAHTTFDVKFYWALFRVGEARLGLDTTLGLGGRDPALLPPAVLGQPFLAATHLAATQPFDVTERQIVGRDRLNRNRGNHHEHV